MKVEVKNKNTRDEECIVTSNRVNISCFDAYEFFEITIEGFDDEISFTTNSIEDIYEIKECLEIVIKEYARKLADNKRIERLDAQIREIDAEIEKIKNGVDN